MIYITEDGQQVATGEVVFNYYDRKLGTIGDDAGDGWFDHIDIDGKRTMLNGERICTVAFAQAKRWVTLRDTLHMDARCRKAEHDAATKAQRAALGLVEPVSCTYCGCTDWEDDEDGNPMCGECGRVKAGRR